MTRDPSRERNRVLVVSNYYHPDHKGGYELQCQAIADELTRRGYDVHILTSQPSAIRDRLDNHIHRLLHLRTRDVAGGLSRRWQHLQWAVHSRLDYRAAYRLMQILTPNIVYVWNMGHLALSPLSAAEDLGLPLAFALADYWLLRRCEQLHLESDSRKRIYRLLIHGLTSFEPFRFSHMHALSSVLKRQYVDTGFPAQRISVIPWGLPSHMILDKPQSLAGRATTELLYAGRLSEEKGVHLAIQAVALLCGEMASELDRPVHLDVVGSGGSSYVQQLRSLVASLDVQRAVRFVGKLEQASLIERYRDYDAVLMPHTWVEPFGAIAIEAMAQGACVVASDLGGPSETISPGQDGILVPPGDPRALARAIVSLVRDSERQDRIRREAIATVRRHYNFDQVGDQVEMLLQAALAQSGRNG